jgi:tetratricopeptide (TPR) repeat protein
MELAPDYVEAINYLGYSYADKGVNLDEALKLIEKAVGLDPDSGYIRDSLGWVYFKMGMYEMALKEIKKALETEIDDPVINEHLGDIYMKLGNEEDAIDAWERSLENHEKAEGLKDRVEEKIKNLVKGSQ